MDKKINYICYILIEILAIISIIMSIKINNTNTIVFMISGMTAITIPIELIIKIYMNELKGGIK